MSKKILAKPVVIWEANLIGETVDGIFRGGVFMLETPTNFILIPAECEDVETN